MLDQLVESRNDFQNTRRGSFMLTTSILVFSLFASGILWSLFAKDLGIGGESLELSSMVAPVVDVEPPKPEPETPKVKQEENSKVASTEIIRKENIANLDEPFIPKDISTKPSSSLSRPKNMNFTIGDVDSTPSGSSSSEREGRAGTGTGEPTGVKNQTAKIEDTDTEPPVIKKKEEPKAETKPKPPVSGGVLNGKAVSLPKPSYPPTAKAVRAGGDVNVQVMIDERGNVVSANAVSGHALLRQVSEQAARSAKFSPTLLGGQPVKVTGIIVYKFAMQ